MNIKPPKEKAKELFNKFSCLVTASDEEIKDIVNASITEIELYRRQIEREYDEDLYHAYKTEEYWKKVKSESN